MIRISILVALAASLTAPAVQAADAPAEIKIGTLYASTGRFASLSMPLHYGLKLWIDQKNAEGGVYVKAFDKKIPLKLIAYDDQSNTATAASATLADLLTLLFLADPGSAVRTSLRTGSHDEVDDGVADRRQRRLRGRAVDSFFPASLF